MNPMTTFNWAPHLLLLLALAAWLYGRGLARLWRRAGRGAGVSEWEAAAYAGGLASLFVAVISPVDAMSAELFSVHMVQHLIIMMVAAPLLVVGKPLFVVLWVLPPRMRRRVAALWSKADVWHRSWDVLSQPLLAWALYAVTLWLWHVPRFYEAALHNPYVHDLQHAAFLMTAALFWWILFNPMGRLKLDRGAGVLYLFTTSLHGSALGVFLALSPEAWYGYYERTIAQWNVTLLEDQQLAGLIMWMPGCLIYIVLAAVIFAVWLRDVDAGVRRLEGRPVRPARRRGTWWHLIDEPDASARRPSPGATPATRGTAGATTSGLEFERKVERPRK